MRLKSIRLVRALAVMTSALLLVGTFQNCQKFEAIKYADLSSTQADSQNQDQNQEDVPSPNPSLPNIPVVEPPVAKPDASLDLTLVNRCDATVLRGSSRLSHRKFTKEELITSAKSLVSGLNEFRELEPFRDFTHTPLANQNPMQIALNDYPGEYVDLRLAGEVFEKVHSPQQITAWLNFSEAFSEFFIRTNAFNRYTSNECVNRSPNPTCLTEFIRRFARSAWRRPLRDDELQTIVSLANSDLKASIKKIVAYSLISPEFMFLLEPGTAQASGRIRLTPHEVASRISYYLVGGPPDQVLSAAADQDQLASLAQVETQARRLIQTPEARKKLQTFFKDWFRLEEFHEPDSQWTQAAEIGIDIYFSHKMKDRMTQELYDFAEHVIWSKKGSFKDLMTEPLVFPRDEVMGKIYKTPFTKEGLPQQAPNNPGLLTRSAVLAASGLNPNTIMRGVTMRRRIFCDEIPSPDFSVVASRVTELGVQDPVRIANHEIVKKTTAGPACASCHALINPLGFAFEAYNPLGQKSSVQRVPLIVFAWERYPDKGKPPSYPRGAESRFISEFPLPEPQTTILDGASVTLNGPDSLIEAVARSERARSCMSVRLFRHFEKRSEKINDSCVLSEMQKQMKDNVPLIDILVKFIANEDIFWRKPI